MVFQLIKIILGIKSQKDIKYALQIFFKCQFGPSKWKIRIFMFILKYVYVI